MAKAEFNGVVIAESDDTVMLEGRHYFPPVSIRLDHFTAVDHSTRCSWKGDASYYDVVVDGETASNAAWYYSEPKDAAAQIRDHVAFYAPPVVVTG